MVTSSKYPVFLRTKVRQEPTEIPLVLATGNTPTLVKTANFDLLFCYGGGVASSKSVFPHFVKSTIKTNCLSGPSPVLSYLCFARPCRERAELVTKLTMAAIVEQSSMFC